MKNILSLAVGFLLVVQSNAQQKFNGLDVNMGNLYRLSDAKTRSISPENFTGEPGKAGMATTGVHIHPSPFQKNHLPEPLQKVLFHHPNKNAKSNNASFLLVSSRYAG